MHLSFMQGRHDLIAEGIAEHAQRAIEAHRAERHLGKFDGECAAILVAALQETARDHDRSGFERDVEAFELESDVLRMSKRNGELCSDETQLERGQPQSSGQRDAQRRLIAKPLGQVEIFNAFEADADLLYVDDVQASVDRYPYHAAALALFVVELDVESAGAVGSNRSEITDRYRKCIHLLSSKPCLRTFLLFGLLFLFEELLNTREDVVGGIVILCFAFFFRAKRKAHVFELDADAERDPVLGHQQRHARFDRAKAKIGKRALRELKERQALFCSSFYIDAKTQ